MRREQVQKIRNAINPRYIRSVLMDLSVYHRLTTSDGIVGAADKAVELMKNAGLKTNLYRYHQNDDCFLKTPCGMEWGFWQCKAGWCEIVGEDGRKLADHQADPISILDNSVSCDYRSTPVEVIYMDRGPEEEKYADIDFTGKIIFIKNQTGNYFNTRAYTSWAIGKRGAIGHILSAVGVAEGLRGTWNQYETISWSGAYKNAFAFGITPKEGDRLERLILEKRAKGEKLEVYCYVDATTDGFDYMHNAEGIIEGENPNEEILLYAHLCHARPSANDNLSGCSAVLAAMYALNELISRGMLPKPKRSIRGVLGAEMIGSLAEVYRKDRVNTRAVFSMDMVGAQQGPVGVGPVFLSDAPRSTPNISNDIASFCMEEVSKDITNYGVEWVCCHNMTETSYSPGSDPDVWNDPMSGAPCSYTGQWPDRFYHSSSDDIATIDPTLIARSAAISAAYAYILATLDVSDLPLFMAKGCENMTRTVVRNGFDGDEAYYGMTMNHLRDFYLKCCDQYVTFFDGEEKAAVEAMVAEQKKRIDAVITSTVCSVLGKDVDLSDYPSDGRDLPAEYQYVPEKDFIGRVFDLGGLCKRNGCYEVYEEFEKNYGRFSFNRCNMIGLFYTDGNHSLAESATRSCLDRRVKDREGMVKALHEYFKVFMAAGVMRIK